MICLAKSIGGGFPLAAFGAHKEVMGLIARPQSVSRRHLQHESDFDGGGDCDVPRSADARELHAHRKAETKLVDGYRKIVAKVGLQGYIASAGANGALMLYPKEIQNYRDWLPIDVDLWRQYWFGMVNRGVMCQPYWWDEQWTISVQHTEADIDQHLAAFADVAPALAVAQHERLGAVVAH